MGRGPARVRSGSPDDRSPTSGHLLSEATTPGTWWRCRALGPDGEPRWFAVVGSTLHPDDTTIDLLEPEAHAAVGSDAECTAFFDARGRVVRIEPGPRYSPTAAELWYVEVPEPQADPPATTLVAFHGHDVAGGMVVPVGERRPAKVRSDDQLAALRWIPATGQAHEVYVGPQWRRRGVATGIGVTVATIQTARGGPRIWGSGARTAMGERWRNGADWAHLAAELDYLEAPMTPFDQREE